MNLSPYRNSDTPIEISIRHWRPWAHLWRRLWVFFVRLWRYGSPLAVRSKVRREHARVTNNYMLKYEREWAERELARLTKEQEGRWSREDD